MKILLTGVTGYIGKQLLPVLLEQGHEVVACVRDKTRFKIKESWKKRVSVLEIDFLNPPDIQNITLDFDAAYYLIHSMTSSIKGFEDKETLTAKHFTALLNQSNAKQVIYLTGITNVEENLSTHLKSRLNVEQILGQGKVPLTALRAGIIIGAGSASFEIIRDLVEKLPVMVAPNWLTSKCEPIAIRNVLQFLTGVLLNEVYYHKHFDISCREILTYKEMLMGYAQVRKLKRTILTIPIMTPRLSSYWLYFITSTSYKLAVNLVNSMKVNVVGKPNTLAEELGITLIPYQKAIELAFSIIEQNAVISSWKDSYVSSMEQRSLNDYIEVPKHGCLFDHRSIPISHNSVEQVTANIWSIGGQRGWYFANWLWRFRGFLDKLVGGIGLRRGRTNPVELNAGDALDFWRVLLADRQGKRLLLFAEMKLPGEAWLEFNIVNKNEKPFLEQTATFRPHGILGRMYWYSLVPIHWLIFGYMIRNIEKYKVR